ncbi:Uncharacterized protein NEOC95_001883 [Neochlamydia sp. AcF95]|nr:Uncharacterized protein [Neochlamydia sp. AcF95]
MMTMIIKRTLTGVIAFLLFQAAAQADNCSGNRCASTDLTSHCLNSPTKSLEKADSVSSSIDGTINSYKREREAAYEQTSPLSPHQFYISPTFYHIRRERSFNTGSSKQHNFIYGVQAGYDRIKRCRLYGGLNALYAGGKLQGRSAKGHKLRSSYREGNVEGRIGYTFQMKRSWMPTFVPYLGYGYLCETNKFLKPSPVIHKMRISYDYFTVGFLSHFYPHPSWVIGINFKTRFLFTSKCKISDDPDPHQKDSTISLGHKIQYRFELPFIYRLNGWADKLALSMVPFYEYRHYGGHPDFPFDFAETKMNNYGFDFRCLYMF